MQALKQWFLQLLPRERILVIAASAVTIVVLFYYVLWAPLNNALETNKAGLASDRELMVWVQEQANRAALLQDSQKGQRFAGSLTQLINQTTRASNIEVSRLQPQGEELQVWIDEVAFNDLMRWLANLEQRGVMILQSDFSETNEDGMVQVRRLQLGKM